MCVETSRLYIYPISNEAMVELIDSEQDASLKQAYSEMLQGCVQNPESRIWYAVWNIALKDLPGTIIGDLSFKGLNADGSVEIGYGLREGYCGNGYMTEAVKAMANWAHSQNGVTKVIAETTTDNLASQRVLLRAGFVPLGMNGQEGPLYLYRNEMEE